MKSLSTDVPERCFPLGQIVITPGALKALSDEEVARAIERHTMTDWGDLVEEDEAANEHALQTGGRLFSSYCSADEVIFWVITEADRTVTTILLPLEY